MKKLAFAVLIQAIKDYAQGDPKAREKLLGSSKKSRAWRELWCEILEINPDTFKERIQSLSGDEILALLKRDKGKKFF